MAGRRLEVATAIALLGGGLFIVAEFLDVYRVERGVVVIQEQTGGANHSYALLIAGAAAIAATLAARSTGAWPPAAAAAVLGVAGLAVAFLGDLPDATSSGLTTDARIAEAKPAAGFWVEVAGGVLTLVGGGALALLLRFGRQRAER